MKSVLAIAAVVALAAGPAAAGCAGHVASSETKQSVAQSKAPAASAEQVKVAERKAAQSKATN